MKLLTLEKKDTTLTSVLKELLDIKTIITNVKYGEDIHPPSNIFLMKTDI